MNYVLNFHSPGNLTKLGLSFPDCVKTFFLVMFSDDFIKVNGHADARYEDLGTGNCTRRPSFILEDFRQQGLCGNVIFYLVQGSRHFKEEPRHYFCGRSAYRGPKQKIERRMEWQMQTMHQSKFFFYFHVVSCKTVFISRNH